MRNSFISNMTELELPEDIIRQVVLCFDRAAMDYDIRPKETGLIVGFEMPELAKTFIAVKSVEGCARGTLDEYRRTLSHFFHEVRLPMEEITANMIRGYLHIYRTERNVQPSRLDKVRQVVCGFFSWAADEGYLEKNPTRTIKPIKCEKKRRNALDRFQLEKLRRACQNSRELALIDLLYSTGCRVSEIVGIKVDDINFKDREFMVWGKGNKQRTVYVNAAAMLSMNEYLKSRKDESPWLFVGERKPHMQLSRSAIGKIVAGIAKRAGVDKCSPHTLRHTAATIALRSGMPVQDIQMMLGHSSINTTMIYAEQDRAAVKAEHERYVV